MPRQQRSKDRITENGLMAGGVVGLSLLAIVLGVGLYYVFGKVVPPGSFGVRQITAGPGQGFSRDGLKPGLHFSVPFFVNIHLVPHTVQVLNFHKDHSDSTEVSDSQDQEQFAGLEVRTSDGLSVVVDVSVLTRFYDAPTTSPQEGDSARKKESHGGPADLFTRVGMSFEDWDSQVRKVAADELRRSLGALLARQFYEVPQDRANALDRATKQMRTRLNPMGISVESILLRRYTYKDDRFDEAIFNKNIQEQEQRLKEASGDLAEVKAQLEQVAASWDAKVETLRIKGESEAQIVRSQAALYENEKKAEGDLAVSRAQADVDRLKASALASSQGATVYVAREMAPLLSSLRGGIISNIDPYDIGEWANRLGAGDEASTDLPLVRAAPPEPKSVSRPAKEVAASPGISPGQGPSKAVAPSRSTAVESSPKSTNGAVNSGEQSGSETPLYKSPAEPSATLSRKVEPSPQGEVNE